MLAMYQCKTFLRLVTILILLLFFPTSVQAWNFLPEERATVAKVPSMPSPGARNLSDTAAPPTAPPPFDASLGGQPSGPAASSDRPSVLPDRLMLAKVTPALKKARETSAAQPLEQVRMLLADATSRTAHVVKGSGSLSSRLSEAARAIESGQFVGPVQDYIKLLDESPRTSGAMAADASLRAVMEAIRQNLVPEQQLVELVAQIPGVETLNSVESRYAVCDFWASMADHAKRHEDEELTSAYGSLCMDSGIETLSGDLDDPLQAAVIVRMVEAAETMGVETVHATALYLKGLLKELPLGAARIAARCELVQFYQNQLHNNPKTFFEHRALMSDLNKGALVGVMDSPSVCPWLKARLDLTQTEVTHNPQEYEATLAEVEKILASYDGSCPAVHQAHIMKIYLLTTHRMDDPNLALSACQEYLSTYPAGRDVDTCLLMAGHVYYRAQDYASALAVYREVCETYPDTPEAQIAAGCADYIGKRHGLESEPETGQIMASGGLPMCGPLALQALLTTLGVDASIENLASVAGTDSEGTTMLGLAQAAEACGVNLVGVEEQRLEDLALPCIAFIGDNHFVFVKEIGQAEVVLVDMGKTLQVMPVEEFRKVWSGKALLGTTPLKLAGVMDDDALNHIKGGDWPLIEYYPNQLGFVRLQGEGYGEHSAETVVREDDIFGLGKTVNVSPELATALEIAQRGFEGPDRTSLTPDRLIEGQLGGVGGSADSFGGGLGAPWCRASTSGSGITPVAEISGGANLTHLGQVCNESDFSFCCSGNMNLKFGRTYSNPCGFIRGHTDGGYPWEDNLGTNWHHSLNVLIITTEEEIEDGDGIPQVIAFITPSGECLYYYRCTNPEDNDGVDKYMCLCLPERKQGQIIRDESLGGYILKYQNGVTYVLGALGEIGDTGYYITRLSSICNESGTSISCSYTDGYLTQVDTPSGDGRSLTFSYDYCGGTTKMTKASLCDGGSPIADVNYSYDPTGNLTAVTKASGLVTTYEYDQAYAVTNSHYMTSRTDQAGQVSYTAYAVAADGHLTKLVATRPDGTSVELLRDNPSPYYASECLAVVSHSGSRVRRVVYDLDDEGGHIGYYTDSVTFSENPDGAIVNGPHWDFHYGTMLNMTKVSVGDPSHANLEYGLYVEQPSGFFCRRVTKMCDSSDVGPSWDFDSTGSRVISASVRGMQASFEYDNLKRLTKVTHPSLGSAGCLYTYDGDGQIITKTDPYGKHTVMGYDAMGNIASLVDPNGSEWQAVYDARGRLLTKTDPNGKSTYLEYADTPCTSCGIAGALTKVTDPCGNETNYEYDPQGNMTKMTDAGSVSTSYEYDCMGRMTQVVFPSNTNNTMAFTYDPLGRVITKSDFNGIDTVYGYDCIDRVTAITVDGEQTMTKAYHGWNFVPRGRLTSVTDGNGHETSLAYEWDLGVMGARGPLTKITDAEGKATLYERDAYHRLTKSGAGSDGSYDPVEWSFDGATGLLGEVQYTNAGTGNSYVEYFYDECARMTQVQDWMGGVATGNHYYEYDAAGRVTRYRDFDDDYANNKAHRVEYTYDAAGQVITRAVVEGNGTANTTYNTIYAYTDTGQVDTLTAPGSRTWDFDYNALGQVTQTTHPNGMTTSYGYDTRNRMTQLEHKDGATVVDGWTYGLDGVGNINYIMDSTDYSIWAYAYDGRYRLTMAARMDLPIVGDIVAGYLYTYDDGDNLLTKVMPFEDNFNDGDYNGWTVASGTFVVDDDYALTKSVTDSTRMYQSTTDADYDMWFSYRWDSSDTTDHLHIYLRFVDWNNVVYLDILPTQIRLQEKDGGTYYTRDTDASATSTEDTWYDVYVRCDDNEITVYRTERGNGSEMAEILYSSAIATTTNASIHYTICGGAEYSLDDIRIASSGLSSTVTYAYNDANELTSMAEGKTGITGSTTGFEYDDWGRTTMMTKASTGDYTLYKYRYGDKLKRVSKYHNSSVLKDMSYMHDGLGKMRLEYDVTDDEYHWFRWDLGWQPLGYYAEGSDAGTIWDIGDRTFSLVPDPLSHGAISSVAAINGSDPATGTYAGMFKDHLGSTRRLRATDKSALGSYEFTPYGQDYFDHGADLPFKFTGKPYHEDIGMYYFPFRFYSPASARWLTRDPLGVANGLNVYKYGAANPISVGDPLGTSPSKGLICNQVGEDVISWVASNT